MIKSREFHVFSVYRQVGFDGAEINKLQAALKAADFSEATTRTTLNAFVEVTLKSQHRIDFIGRLLREYCAEHSLGFGEGRGKLVAVYSFGKLVSRPTGETVTEVIEAARYGSGK
ncbi:MAG: hypothetical protein OEN20_04710 [Gammaproteobacteria bacterium]|nr:hypothetical protein [Gammaproteobacteria bacterium]